MSAYIPDATWYDYETVSNIHVYKATSTFPHNSASAFVFGSSEIIIRNISQLENCVKIDEQLFSITQKPDF